MSMIAVVVMVAATLFTTAPAGAQAPPVGARVVGTNCFIGGRYVFLEGRSTCPASPPPSAGRTSTPPTTSPGLSAVQSGAYQLGYGLGYAIGSWLVGGGSDPAARQRAAEEARLAEERLAETLHQRSLEEQRRRDELHQRLISAFKGTGLTDVTLKRFDDTGGGLRAKGVDSTNELALKLGEPGRDDLRPKGTSFFGLGGGAPSPAPAPEPASDPMVVDLRHVQHGAVLVTAAAAMDATDADLIVNEALNAANGEASFLTGIPAGVTVPIVSERGLLAFQQANARYTKERDALVQRTLELKEAHRRRSLAEQRAEEARVELERALADNVDRGTLEQKHRTMAAVFAAARREAEAWEKARKALDETEARAYRSREKTVAVLRAVAQGQDPYLDPVAAPGHPIVSLNELGSLDQADAMRLLASLSPEELKALGERLMERESNLKVAIEAMKKNELRAQMAAASAPDFRTWKDVLKDKLLNAVPFARQAEQLGHQGALVFNEAQAYRWYKELTNAASHGKAAAALLGGDTYRNVVTVLGGPPGVDLSAGELGELLVVRAADPSSWNSVVTRWGFAEARSRAKLLADTAKAAIEVRTAYRKIIEAPTWPDAVTDALPHLASATKTVAPTAGDLVRLGEQLQNAELKGAAATSARTRVYLWVGEQAVDAAYLGLDARIVNEALRDSRNANRALSIILANERIGLERKLREARDVQMLVSQEEARR